MFKFVFTTLKGYKKEYIKNDIFSGIIVAVLSIPVSMGYAQVAGIDPIYGLYACLLPIIAYAIFASSKQLIFGLDSSGSAIVGALLVTVGIAPNTSESFSFVSTVTLVTGVFMVLFSILRFGRFVSYISEPVMSGFVCGTSLTVLLGQFPKMLGMTAESTGFFDKILEIIKNIGTANTIAVVMGLAALVILIAGKKFLPQIPFSLILLVIGTMTTDLMQLDKKGIVIIGEIPQGLPKIILPNLAETPNLPAAILGGLVLAILLSADSILTSNSFAVRNDYKISEDRELFAFGAANIASAFTSMAPVSSSMSRTATNEQYGGKSQVVSITVAGVITIVLLFLSKYLYFMPQPVLSSIVFASVIGVAVNEFKNFVSIWRNARKESIIWLITMLAVIMIGVMYGIIVGLILSFFVIIVSDSISTKGVFLGVIEDKAGYYDLKRNEVAEPLNNLVIYRQTNALFFSNIKTFITDIEKAIRKNPDVKAIIIDAHGINDIDLTAVKSLDLFLEHLKVDYYFANTIGSFRDSLREKGLEYIITEGHITKSIDEAVELTNSTKNIV